jgi:hypothetical protein
MIARSWPCGRRCQPRGRRGGTRGRRGASDLGRAGRNRWSVPPASPPAGRPGAPRRTEDRRQPVCARRARRTLRIRIEEALPVYERLSDLRERASPRARSPTSSTPAASSTSLRIRTQESWASAMPARAPSSGQSRRHPLRARPARRSPPDLHRGRDAGLRALVLQLTRSRTAVDGNPDLLTYPAGKVAGFGAATA